MTDGQHPGIDLTLFGLGMALGVLLTPVRGLLARTLPHAAWHPDCAH